MRTAVGLMLVVAGAIGTLVPIVPGLALVLAGIAVLGPHHRLSRALTRRGRAWIGKKEGSVMKCPKCGTLLNEVTKAGVLIDVCDRPPEREPAWRDDDER